MGEKPGSNNCTPSQTAATSTSTVATAAATCARRSSATRTITAAATTATSDTVASRPDGWMCGGCQRPLLFSARRYRYANRKPRKKKASPATNSRAPMNSARSGGGSVWMSLVIAMSVSGHRGQDRAEPRHRRGVGVAVLVGAGQDGRYLVEVLER